MIISGLVVKAISGLDPRNTTTVDWFLFITDTVVPLNVGYSFLKFIFRGLQR